MANGNLAPKAKLQQIVGGALVAPIIVNDAGGDVSESLDLQGFGEALGCQGAAVLVNVGATLAGDTLSTTNKFTLTLSEGDEADGSDAELVTLPQAVVSDFGVGKDAQGNDFENGVIAVVDGSDSGSDNTDYVIQYSGKKPVITVGIALSGDHENGTPFGVNVFPINIRRAGTSANL